MISATSAVSRRRRFIGWSLNNQGYPEVSGPRVKRARMALGFEMAFAATCLQSPAQKIALQGLHRALTASINSPRNSGSLADDDKFIGVPIIWMLSAQVARRSSRANGAGGELFPQAFSSGNFPMTEASLSRNYVVEKTQPNGN
jgi:hypothetical protein